MGITISDLVSVLTQSLKLMNNLKEEKNYNHMMKENKSIDM